MSQAPVMPVSTDAFTADTTHLSAEEVGAYWLLLCALWRNNGDPFDDDDIRLARICRVTPARWRTKLRPVLVNFFDLSDKVWRQKRLEKEWKKVQEHKAISRDKAKARWDRNSLKENDSYDAAASSQHMPETCSPNPTPNPVEEKEEEDTREIKVLDLESARDARASGRYVFEGQIIRLTKINMDQWRASFWAYPDLVAELTAIDARLFESGHRGLWFAKVAGWLRTGHDRLVKQAEARKLVEAEDADRKAAQDRWTPSTKSINEAW